MSGKPAARVSDPTACPIPGHGVNPIASGSADVLFDGLPAARQGDVSACGGALVGGLSSTVFINGRPAATLGSVGSHGNTVIGGSGTVIIGDSHVPAPFVAPLPLVMAGVFNQTFEFKTASGKQIEDLQFFIRSVSGIEKSGVTSVGISSCISTGGKSEVLTVLVSAE